MAKRIGICRALHAYHHYAFWRTFYSELGWEVVLSDVTNRPVIEMGAQLGPADLCLPVKTFLGHVAMLKESVDALLLPRVVCRRVARDWFFGCPKAMALPDLVRAVFDSLPAVVEPVLDERVQDCGRSYLDSLPNKVRLGPARAALRLAEAASETAGETTRADGSPLHMFAPAKTSANLPAGNSRIRVGIFGHPYLLFDSELSLGVLDKVGAAGAEPVLVFPDEGAVEQEARRGDALNWYYELELLAAARRLLEVERVDGLLLVASFACGTGAVTNDVIQHAAVHRYGVPAVTLLFDEHTGEAGLVTRVESFVDLLRLKKR